MADIVQTGFDYGVIEPDTAMELRLSVERIRLRLKRSGEDIIAIGQELIAAKERLGHGRFGIWLRSEFDMTSRTATTFMNVAEAFSDKSEIISDLSLTVIYQLVAPSTPELVRDQVKSGDVPAENEHVKEAIRRAKDAERQAEEAKRHAISAEQALLNYEETQAWRDRKYQEAVQKAEQLEADITRLQAQITEQSTPVERIIEVPVVPDSVTEELRLLREERDKAVEDRAKWAAKVDQVVADRKIAAYRNDHEAEIIRHWHNGGEKLLKVLREGLTIYPATSDLDAFEHYDRKLAESLRKELEQHLQLIRQIQSGIHIVVDAAG